MTVTALKMKLMNKSGIYPSGNRVLIYPDPIPEEVTESGIILPQETRDKYETAQASGTLIASGPDAFCHVTERTYHVHDDDRREFVEERVRGYSEPFALPGERVSYAKYSGQRFKGKDGKRYLVINDEDITTKLDPEVEISDLDTRERVQ